MGCDIHLYMEKKTDNGWERVRYIHDLYFRSYWQFAQLGMTGRAYGTEPLFELKGLPQNLSEFVQRELDEYGGDGHSPSYLTLQEMGEKLASNKDAGPQIWEIFEEMQSLFKKHKLEDKKDFRLVYWFDN